jgi:hypothetical protein
VVQPISVQAHAHPRPRYPQKRRKCSGDLEGNVVSAVLTPRELK